MAYKYKTPHKKEWINCPSCGRPIHKDRGCFFCSQIGKKEEPHLFVEDDILAYQYHSLVKCGDTFKLIELAEVVKNE